MWCWLPREDRYPLLPRVIIRDPLHRVEADSLLNEEQRVERCLVPDLKAENQRVMHCLPGKRAVTDRQRYVARRLNYIATRVHAGY